MELADVTRLIEQAFVGTKRDEECTLHQAQLADQSMSREITDEEWESARGRDSQLDWRDVPSAYLDECDAALAHLSPQGWHFYLPAYLRRALELLEVDLLSTWLPGSVIFFLNFPPPSKGLDWYRLERFKRLSTDEVRAVVAFLEYVVANPTNDVPSYSEDAARALKRYWSLSPHERPQGLIRP
jgi:uncharacterized protein DUF6714